MSGPAALAAGYVRARRAVPVLINQPIHGDEGIRRFRGNLLGAMYARGEIHHYRVEDEDGTLYLVPPHWLVGTPPLLVPAAALEMVL
jgi:hypothetical protein